MAAAAGAASGVPSTVAMGSMGAVADPNWAALSQVDMMAATDAQEAEGSMPSALPEPPATAAAAPAAPAAPTPPQTEAGGSAAAVQTISYRPGPSIHTAEVLALIVKYFPAAEIGNAMAVSRCESGHSNAIGALNSNGTRDWGVFQLNDGGTLQGALRRIGVAFGSTAEAQQLALDAETNVRAARVIWADRGWAPWVCAYKTGVVASLYSRTPGPMAGKYDERGLVGTVDLTRTQPASGTPMPAPALPASTPTAPAAAPPTPTATTTPPAGPPPSSTPTAPTGQPPTTSGSPSAPPPATPPPGQTPPATGSPTAAPAQTTPPVPGTAGPTATAPAASTDPQATPTQPAGN